MLTRLGRLDWLSAIEPMVAAAAPAQEARLGMERFLDSGRQELRRMVAGYEGELSESAREAPAQEMQRRFAFLRLRFNALLADFDTFADVMTQRSETPHGIWLAGLDVAAADALDMPGSGIEAPPVVCYLDRGHGAAIRRARTRLATGGQNPVAIIRVPRERMVGSGIAASLFHEVGHQAAALLDLVPSLRRVLGARQLQAGADKAAWAVWERWISEIAADFWAMCHLGAGATLGLFGVLSLPKVFVFRMELDDPHPFPWMRAMLSFALGRALYPQPFWDRMESAWCDFYPMEARDASQRGLLELLLATLPEFVQIIVDHRPPRLGGRTIPETLGAADRTPATLGRRIEQWRMEPAAMHRARPSLALAVLGHARAMGRISPEAEAKRIHSLLRGWALRRSLHACGPAGSSCSCRRGRPRL